MQAGRFFRAAGFCVLAVVFALSAHPAQGQAGTSLLSGTADNSTGMFWSSAGEVWELALNCTSPPGDYSDCQLTWFQVQLPPLPVDPATIKLFTRSRMHSQGPGSVGGDLVTLVTNDDRAYVLAGQWIGPAIWPGGTVQAKATDWSGIKSAYRKQRQ